MKRTLLFAFTLLVSSGCLAASHAAPLAMTTGAPTSVFDWHPGAWWTYVARFEGDNRTYDVALVVDRVSPTAYVVGSNLSGGFFGLPFDGNVSRAGLNPTIAGQEWPLFEFPLADGKTWTYTLLGYPVVATAHVAPVDLAPGLKTTGFSIDASSYGRLFARYTYAPAAGWFTRLTIFEPTNGTVAADVRLTGEGASWARDYFVETPVAHFAASYPSTDTSATFRIASRASHLLGTLVVEGDAGAFSAKVTDPDGHPVLAADVLGRGLAIDRRGFDAVAGEWRLDALAAGVGNLRLDVFALESKQGNAGVPPAIESSAIARAVASSSSPGERALFATGATGFTGHPQIVFRPP
ncbi:MAG: hypothetical protein ACYDCK_03560 [Thermoplasmatota archaeon]